MTLTYATACSGIEAPTVAWKPLGWRCAWMSEIDRFPSAVLAHHYPDVPNLGDMTQIKRKDTDKHGAVDVLIAGTPCQSFSVAGLRKGMDDPRGNLAIVFLRLAAWLRSEWLVWENVPGVLSSNGGRDFGAFLGALVQLGYGWAYRVLDAQYFGVAQRRQRVFVVGHLGDWRRAAAVLFERESLSGHPAPRRETRAGVAGNAQDCAGAGIPYVSPALKARDYKGPSSDGDGDGAPILPVCFDTTQVTSPGNYSNPKPGDPTHPLAAGAHAPAIAIQERAVSENLDNGPQGKGYQEGIGYTLEACNKVQSVAFQTRFARNGRGAPENICPTLSGADAGATSDMRPCVQHGYAVRRLTPRECERLQGFPDDYTLIPYRGKPADQCPDGPRYKALGNSMAVPVVRWIGKRIEQVNHSVSHA